MELKYLMTAHRIIMLCCFNRTFMELKYRICRDNATTQKVLIVPLWN